MMDSDAPEAIEIMPLYGARQRIDFAGKAKPLGKAGGAGTVFEHPDLPMEAVKLYKDPKRAADHEAKVVAMLGTVPPEVRTVSGVVQMAWPSATVLVDGRFAGFTMPKIDLAHAWALEQVIRPALRLRRKIPERMDLRLYAARNLVSLLQALHNLNHYFVDLKPQNIFVYRDDAGSSAAYVALIDCDGFQIRDRNGRRFDAELATLEFLHPDVATITGDEVTFDAARINDLAAVQDDFALAVILFQLLNNGLHPMQGVETGFGPVPESLADRLPHGGKFYPYGVHRPNPLISPMPTSLHSWFDPDLRHLFDRAFAGGSAPPSPAEWLSVLDRLQGPGYTCSRAEDHHKLGAVCGQCAIAGVAEPIQKELPKRKSPSVTAHDAPEQPPAAVPVRRWRKKPAAGIAAVTLFLGWCVFSGVIKQPRILPGSSEVAVVSPSTENAPVAAPPVDTAPSQSAAVPPTPDQAAPAQAPSDQTAPDTGAPAQTNTAADSTGQSQATAGTGTDSTPDDSPAAPAPVLVLAPGQADEEALGLRSAQRAEVQVALGSLGLYNGAADGAFGPHTRSAISLYQQQQSAAVTGYLTAGQWAALHQIALQVAANAGNSGQTGDGTTSTTSNDALRNAWLGK